MALLPSGLVIFRLGQKLLAGKSYAALVVGQAWKHIIMLRIRLERAVTVWGSNQVEGSVLTN